LGRIPDHPRVELDYSLLVSADTRFADVVTRLEAFDHSLLKHQGSMELDIYMRPLLHIMRRPVKKACLISLRKMLSFCLQFLDQIN
jgi:hypothetical protein